jgi:hypothetical protein
MLLCTFFFLIIYFQINVSEKIDYGSRVVFNGFVGSYYCFYSPSNKIYR